MGDPTNGPTPTNWNTAITALVLAPPNSTTKPQCKKRTHNRGPFSEPNRPISIITPGCTRAGLLGLLETKPAASPLCLSYSLTLSGRASVARRARTDGPTKGSILHMQIIRAGAGERVRLGSSFVADGRQRPSFCVRFSRYRMDMQYRLNGQHNHSRFTVSQMTFELAALSNATTKKHKCKIYADI